jgi:C-terminal processing protease CtpA/Prc
LIEPLRDAHTSLDSDDLGRHFQGFRPPQPGGPVEADVDALSAHVWGVVRRAYLEGPARSWLRGHLGFGRLRGGAAYLRVDAFADYAASGAFADEHAALVAALDEAFTLARGASALVIDVRVNGGGSDVFGLELASRLAREPYVAFAKVARNDPDDPTRFTPPQPSVVRPSEHPGFRGPVALLTSGYTVSAGETFAQALLGRTPPVCRVGEPTQGVFSDVLVRTLPNGWRFGLPNELFLTAEGATFDGEGVPPEVAVPALPAPELAAGRDPALERALALLRSGAPRGAGAHGPADGRGPRAAAIHERRKNERSRRPANSTPSAWQIKL